MSSKEFIEAWNSLQPIQKKAAEWDVGPMLILAGPGSGKTRVLTCRIAHIIDSNQNKNFRILALTFTNKAADEMRSRFINFVPGQENRIFLGTFHSFCADVLRQHGTHLNINPNYNIYSQDADLQLVLNDAIKDAMEISDVVSELDKKVLPVIKRLKSRLILPDDIGDVFEDAQFGKRMSVVYKCYEDQLTKRNALDFDSLILKTYQLFSKYPNLAKRYRSVYPYICIDEFQDTNHAQYSLIRVLTGDQYNNLFVVADDDQIIYQWNGASHKRIVDFRNDYSAEVIQLPVVYRCPTEIVELANNLIINNFLRTPNKKPLQAFHNRKAQDKDIVRLLPVFLDFEAETTGIARDIKERHADDLGSVVILGRSRKLLLGVEQALKNEGLPAIISQRKDEFESAPFVWLHSILRLSNDRQNRNRLEIVCGSFFKLTGINTDPDEIITQSQSSNNDYLRFWVKQVILRNEPKNNQVNLIVNHILHILGEGIEFISFSKLAINWFNETIQANPKLSDETTIAPFLYYEEELIVWEDLMREITESLGSEITLEAFLQELQMRSKESAPRSNTIVLMTIHGSKGKEFAHVYLVGLVDDELPSFQSKQKGDNGPEMEEERRNCFVAITRTISTLTLSYAKKYRGWPKYPSRFLYEMGLLKQ